MGAGTIGELALRLEGRTVVPPTPGAADYRGVCAAATISEALRDAAPGQTLLVPLGNVQVVRAAALLGVAAVVVCGPAEPEPEAVALAREEGVAVITTALELAECRRRIEREASGRPVQAPAPSVHADGRTTDETFPILGSGYFMAGRASKQVRRALEAAGLDPDLVRRATIATYEAEMNVVINAPSGQVSLRIQPPAAEICVTDNGPGIADVELAMQPGYSTAPPKARALGFGAGMGLPNIADCCDELEIGTDSHRGGARLLMRFRPRRQGGEKG